MNIRVTEKAIEQVKKEANTNKFLRIALDRSGCCGYAFVVSLGVKQKDDIEIECDGIKVLLSERAKYAVNNVEIDFGRRGLQKGFYIKLV